MQGGYVSRRLGLRLRSPAIIWIRSLAGSLVLDFVWFSTSRLGP